MSPARPRVVSLLPSATEIAVAVGMGNNLLGRSHECDFPSFVQALPVLTSTKLEKGLTSLEIDRRVQEIVRQGLSVYAVNADLLRALKPDVRCDPYPIAMCGLRGECSSQTATISSIDQDPGWLSLQRSSPPASMPLLANTKATGGSGCLLARSVVSSPWLIFAVDDVPTFHCL